MQLRSYPKIFNIGHAAVKDLTKNPVVVEEKVDGSQISLGVFDGELLMRSKGAQLQVLAPDSMFRAGVEAVKSIQHLLTPNWIYRGEYLAKKHHNGLVYDRIPKNHIIIFDINTGMESYLSPQDRAKEAERIGFESIPVLFQGIVEDAQKFRDLLKTTSVLGGQLIEGVVVKPEGYGAFGADGGCLMAKFVSEAFKEVQGAQWKKENPTSGDVLDRLRDVYRTPARWAKAVQHLKELGKLENSPKDIGLLIPEVPKDVLEECEAEIKDKLFQWAWPHLKRMLTQGLPEWYKERLIEIQFEDQDLKPGSE